MNQDLVGVETQKIARGYVEKLIVENFKSYAGRHEIGPLKRFSCIIGPNGSGKSNLMDALSFVLGIQAKHLRGDRLIDLVYRREEETLEGLDRNATVTLVLALPGEVDERMHVGRVINSKGESHYKFGIGVPPNVKARNIDFESLQVELKKINIFVRARNFLVFQGDVMDLARRQGQELTRIIETISGSDMLRTEMEDLVRERTIAEEKQRVFFSQKRKTEQQKSELEREKTDLESYNTLKAAIKRLTLESRLYGMILHDAQIEKARKELEKARQVVTEKQAIFDEKQNIAIETEKMKKQITSQVNIAEEQLRKLQTEVSDKHELKDTLRKQQHSAAKSLKESTDKCEALQAKIENRMVMLEAASTDAQEGLLAVNLLKEEIAELEKDVLTKDQRLQWSGAEAKAEKKNKDQKRLYEKKLEELEELRTLDTDYRKARDDISRRKEEVQRKVQNLRKSVESHGRDISATKEMMGKDEKELKLLVEEENKLKTLRNEIMAEKVKGEEKLGHIRATQAHSSNRRARQDIVNDLKHEFSGVIERVSELIVPTSQNNTMALNTALQGASNHIMCDTAATARNCVAWLKKQKREVATFLPMDTLKLNVERRLPQLCRKNGRKIASNICKINDRFYQSAAGEVWEPQKNKITDIILGSTMGDCIVCEDLQDARSIAYDEAKKANIRCRVVTAEGDMIRQNGNMVSADGNKVSFGQKTGEQEERRQLNIVKEMSKDVQEANEELSKISNQLRATKDRIAENTQIINAAGGGSSTQELAKLEEELSNQIRELEKFSSKIEKCQIDYEATEKALAEAELSYQESSKNIFADLVKKFGAQLGVPDLRQLLLDRKKSQKIKKHELKNLMDQVNINQAEVMRWKSQVSGEDRLLKGLQEDKELKEKTLRQIIAKGEKFEVDMEGDNEKLLEKKNYVLDSKAEFERLENKSKETRAEFTKAKTEINQARLAVRKSDKVKPECQAKYNKMVNAHLEGIQIPVKECPEEYRDPDGFISGTLYDEERNPDQIETIIQQVKLDYDVIPKDVMEITEAGTDEERNQLAAKYKKDIDERQKDIDRLPTALNLNAQQEYIDLCAQFKDQTEEAEKMVKIFQDLTRQYEKVKDARYEKYMTCFREIEKHVDPIYKELTSFDGRDGGSAFLDPESLDEPYAAGTSFTACPPGKRFFDMSLLSGGEKSMASMALLMAMHSHNPPPFMILDEVDAPFDSKNTRSLVKFLKKMPFQSIVISLKDKFFCHADACVGVYKDKKLQTSGTITSDLSGFGNEEV